MDFTQKFEESCQTCQPEQDNFVILKAVPWETTQCKKSAFSLMEMMTVMLVVSVIMALSAPMITKKNAGDVSIRSLWTALKGGNIGYNLGGEPVTAIIGGGDNQVATMGTPVPRLTLASDGQNPHIGFMYAGDVAGKLSLRNNGIEFGSGAEISDTGAIAMGIEAPDLGGAKAKGKYSIAIGSGITAESDSSIAIGTLGLGSSSARGAKSIVIGSGAYTDGDYGISIGACEMVGSTLYGGTGAGLHSVAIGARSYATTNAVALGYASETTSSGIAIGNQAKASGSNSIALGSYYQTGGGGDYKTAAKGSHAISIGSGAIAAKDSSIAIGAPQYLGSGYSPSSNASGNYSIAIGSAVNATSDHSIAIGSADSSSQTNAGIGSVAIGRAADVKNNGIGIGNNVSAANNTIAIGVTSQSSAGQTKTKASGSQTVAIGHGVEAVGTDSIAIGSSAGDAAPTRARHKYSIAIGHSARAGSGLDGKDFSNTIAIGHAATISDNVGNSIAIGGGASAVFTAIHSQLSAKNMIAIGPGAKVSANNTIAIGSGAQASQKDSIAIGPALATGENTIAIGTGSSVEAPGAIAIGHGISLLDTGVSNGSGGTSYINRNVIQLGNSSSIIQIPGTVVFNKVRVSGDAQIRGNLYVGGNSYLGTTSDVTSRTYIRAASETDLLMIKRYSSGGGLYTDETTPSGSLTGCMSGPYPKSWWCSKYSDRRMKDLVGENLDAMDKINKLKVYNYTYKKDDLKTPRVGVVAQELEKIFPNAISKDENGFLQIRHEDMFYAMINALKELYAKLVEKDHEITVLKKEVKELRKEVNELKKLIKNR